MGGCCINFEIWTYKIEENNKKKVSNIFNHAALMKMCTKCFGNSFKFILLCSNTYLRYNIILLEYTCNEINELDIARRLLFVWLITVWRILWTVKFPSDTKWAKLMLNKGNWMHPLCVEKSETFRTTILSYMLEKCIEMKTFWCKRFLIQHFTLSCWFTSIEINFYTLWEFTLYW